MVTAHIQTVALKQQISTPKKRDQAAKEINMYKPISISAIALCICALSGCSEAKCWSKLAPAERNCDYYSGAMLSRCHSEGSPHLPNCDVVEYCTDYSTIETDSSTDSDTSEDSGAISDSDSLMDTNTGSTTDTDSDTTIPTGIVCKYVCEGKLVPCDSFSSESQCTRAAHCEWYDNSVD